MKRWHMNKDLKLPGESLVEIHTERMNKLELIFIGTSSNKRFFTQVERNFQTQAEFFFSFFFHFIQAGSLLIADWMASPTIKVGIILPTRYL